MLEINERKQADTTILDLTGNVILGGSSKAFGSHGRAAVAAGKTDLLINFARVKYIDSSGVGELLALQEAVSAAEGKLRLQNLPPKVEEVLTLSGVLPIFEIAEDENAD